MKTFLLLTLFCCIQQSTSYAQCSCSCDTERDSTALIAFYNSTNLTLAALWNTNEPMADWFGVTVNQEGCVEQLALSDHDITGTIPPEIGDLECLKTLSLPFNELTGEIPVEITSLSCLEILTLSLNELTGEIPSEIGNLSQLKTLGLNSNKLTGTLPQGIENLVNLSSLALHDNQLEGCIPESFQMFCDINLFNLKNGKLPFRGRVEYFCNGDNQIGANCWNGGPGIIDEDCNCIPEVTNVNTIENHSINIHPNPVGDKVNISASLAIDKVSILSISGQQLKEQIVNDDNFAIECETLSAGIYIIKLWLDGSVIETGKFVKS